MILLSEW